MALTPQARFASPGSQPRIIFHQTSCTECGYTDCARSLVALSGKTVAIIADGLVHEHAVIVRVEPEQVEGQQLAQLRQNRAQQALLPDQQRPALGPSRRNVG